MLVNDPSTRHNPSASEPHRAISSPASSSLTNPSQTPEASLGSRDKRRSQHPVYPKTRFGFHRWAPPLTQFLTEQLPTGFEQGLGWLGRRPLLLLLGLLGWASVPLITLRASTWQQQAVLAVGVVLLGTLLVQLEDNQPQDNSPEGIRNNQRTSERFHLLLIALSTIMTLRYWYYRTFYTLNFEGILNTFFSLLLYAAELYAIATLFLAYFQTLRIRDRRSIPLDTIPEADWPTVDIYIPTYNEDVDIVRKTVIGALSIHYPKTAIYVLDDGRAEKYRERRRSLQQMCDELDCTMLTRDNNEHAKAGNINTALPKTQGDLVLILDCDHIPACKILSETVGFFQDPRVALVQTPHWFYNPDPFERNLRTRGRIPVGNELFYKVLQKGNDTWNATFFCGSAAIIRRDSLLEVGGIATETVTEDCHTALRLHSRGLKTIYYDKIMVAGLAPEMFSSYVGQQVRWARGMAQILRLENPLFNRQLKLTIPQRICYFSATSHFFFGFPRLMYLIAPALYLLFGINSVKGLGVETLFYALPYVILSMQTNYIPYKHVRFSFWNEIYEFAMSFQAGIVTLLALINPKLGSFNVTDKGLTVTKRSFDVDSIRYLVVLGVIGAASLLAVPLWLWWSPADTQAVLINAFWCLFNLILVIAACLVAFEQPQLRKFHRLPRQIQAIIHADGQSWPGKTINLSEGGTQILLPSWPNIPGEVRVEFVGDFGARALLNAQVVRAAGTRQLEALLSLQFLDPTPIQRDDLTVVLYSDVDEWYSQKRDEQDIPLESLQFIATSIRRVFEQFRPEMGVQMRKRGRSQAQLYWEGWGSETKIGQITELGLQDLRIEIDCPDFDEISDLEILRPTLGILVFDPSQSTPYSLIARVQSLEFSSSQMSDRAALELSFPKELQSQQRGKIKQILSHYGEQ